MDATIPKDSSTIEDELKAIHENLRLRTEALANTFLQLKKEREKVIFAPKDGNKNDMVKKYFSVSRDIERCIFTARITLKNDPLTQKYLDIVSYNLNLAEEMLRDL